MIFEIAAIKVKQGQAEAFEAAAGEAVPLFKRAKGCRSMQLQRSIEHPDNYTLVVGWDTVDNHMVDFRNSDDFQEWRRLVGPHFDGAPVVHHVDTVLNGF